MMGKTKTKTLIISFLLAAVAACLSVALVACSGGEEKDSRVYNVGEEGVYYYDATSSAEYLMTLQSGTYMISTDGYKGYSGTYSYDETAGAISFTDSSGDKFEAAFSDDAMQLAIENTRYTFLKKVDYTVTFRDGASDVETQSVTYGRKASAPETDGTRIFLGWYTDAAFTTEYKFDTAVTEDLTLYAYYIDIDETIANYDVTFVMDGADVYATKTQNGIVYDIPAYEGVLGWWVSATNKEGELTYEYGGETLTENTKLFAVKEGSLGASIYGDKITWEGSASSATVTIEGVGTFTATGSPYSYDFSSLPTGTYNITVEAQGYGEENLVYVSNALSRVSTFAVYGNYLVYNAVENAEYYYVSVTCGNASHDHEMVYNGSTLTYDFSSCEMGPDGISFTVYAYASGYVESVSDTFVYALILDGTTVTIDFATDTASWTAVSGASGYEVYVNGELVDTTTETKYSLKYYDIEEKIAVSVKPVAPGYYSEESEAAEYTKATLRAPEITSVSGYEISWEKIDGAVSYELNINGNLVTVEPLAGEAEVPTTFVLSDTTLGYIFSDARNAVSVMAIGATVSENSQYGDITYVTDTVMGSALSYADGTVAWNYALAAISYTVELDDAVVGTVSGVNTCKITFTHSGESVIKVYFDESSFAELTVYTYAVIFNSEGGSLVDTIYVAKGDTLVLETPVYPNGDYENTFLGWYTLPDPEGMSFNGYDGDGIKIESGSVFTGNSSLILYASWEILKNNTLFVVGDYGDIDGETETYYDIPVGMSSYVWPVPATDDAAYAFVGWFTEANGQGTQYSDHEGASLLTFNNTNIKTVYAYWVEVLEFSVTSYSGTNYAEVKKGSEISLAPGGEVTVPASYTIDGTEYVVGVIGSGAFNSVSALRTLNIPDTVIYIPTVNNGYASGTGAFASSANIGAVNVYATGDDVNTTREIIYYSENGVLFRKTDDGGAELIYYPRGKSDAAYVMPEYVSNEYEYELNASMQAEKVYRPVTQIAQKVFNENRNIYSVTISATVTNIEIQAFQSATRLQSVTFSDAALNNVGIPAATDLTIATRAFQDCTSLSDVTLPSRLQVFDPDAFDGCTAFKTVSVADGGTYSSYDGILYSGNNTLYYCPRAREEAVTWRAGTTIVAERAFEGCTKLTSISIPSSVTTISAQAFSGCTGITNVTFEGDENANPLAIYEKAFYGCTYITEITIPARAETIGAQAFAGCTRLVTVTYDCADGATAESLDFAEGAFGTTVTTINFGANVPLIENFVSIFGGSNLTVVSIDSLNTNYIEDTYGVVYGIYSETETILMWAPNISGGTYTVMDGCTAIGANAFLNKNTIVNITISKTVESIMESAFYGCSNLSTVTFADGSVLETIENYAFAGTALTAITIPASVKYMGEYEDGVLVAIDVFDDCASLTSIGVETGNMYFSSANGILYAAENGVPTQLVLCPVKNSVTEIQIPATVTKIWDNAFTGTTITKVTFAEGRSADTELEFGDGVFQNSALREIELPTGLTAIPEKLFENCTALTTVSIPYTVTDVGGDAFYGCTALTTVTFEGLPADAEGAGKDYSLVFEEYYESQRSYGIFYGCTTLKEIAIPDRTTTLATYMFGGCTALEKAIIGAGVTTLPENLFRNCYNLKTIEFGNDENAEVKLDTIESGAFYNVGQNVAGGITISLPSSVTSLGNYAFRYCYVSTLTLNEGLETMGKYIFGNGASYNHATVTELEIPSTVTSMDEGVVAYTTTLKTITFAAGSKLEAIPAYAFYECSSLGAIEIPATVESIGNYAFRNCTSLSNVSFAVDDDTQTSALSSFGTYVFQSCTALTTFTFPATDGAITLGNYMFYGCKNLTTLVFSSGITSLGSALSGCYSITTIDTTNCKAFVADDTQPILYTRGDDGNTSGTLVYVFGDVNGDFTVPESVTAIDNNAFLNQTTITSVKFPYTITKIGDYAFDGCLNLSGITFYTVTGGAASSLSIGTAAFRQTAISSIDFTGFEEVTIGSTAFAYCPNLKTVTLTANLSMKEGTGTAVATLGTFAYCTSLETVILNGLTSIPALTFYGCTKLTTVAQSAEDAAANVGVFDLKGVNAGHISFAKTSPTKVILSSTSTLGTGTNLGGTSGVFNGCTTLTTVILGGIKSVPTYTFYGCSSLICMADTEEGLYIDSTPVVNISGLTSYEDSVFYSCSKIQMVVLNPDVTIGNNMFTSCSALTTIGLWNGTTITYELGVANLSGTTIPNAAFTASGLTKVKFSSTTSISAGSSNSTGAFRNCSSITEIDLGGLTSISWGAFNGCSKLATVTGAEYVTSIEAYAFYNCSALTKFENDGVLTSIGDYAFYGCKALTAVGNVEGRVNLSGLTSSSTLVQTFYNCALIEEVVLAEDVTIGACAFDGCTSLKALATSVDGLYINGNPVVDLTYNNMTQSTSGGSGRHFRYTAVETLILGKNTYVSCAAFQGCPSLTTVCTSVNNIEYGIANLSGINLQHAAFYDSGVERVKLSSMTDMAAGSGVGESAGAFAECKSLVYLDLGDLPEVVTDGFYNCSALKTVTRDGGDVEEGLADLRGIAVGKAAFANTAIEKVILNEGSAITAGSATAVQNLGSFGNCVSLKEVVLGQRSIPAYSFYGCTALTTLAYDEASLKDGVINLDGIDASATYIFYGCTAITEVLLGDNTAIGQDAFYGCTALTTVGDTYMTADLSGVSVGIASFTGSGIVTLVLSADTSITAGTGTAVGTSGAFSSMPSLTSVDFGGIKTIPAYTFYNCDALIEISGMGSVTSIGNYAFYDCDGIEAIIGTSSLTSIGNYAFYDCDSLVEFADKDALTSIGTYAFYGCAELAKFGSSDELANMDGVTSIGDYAFGYCSSIGGFEVTSGTSYAAYDGILYSAAGAIAAVPNGISGKVEIADIATSVGAYAFVGNESITEVVFPESVTSIGNYAFQNCTQLTTVTIAGEGVTIGDYAFAGCTSLESVGNESGLGNVGQYAFSGDSALESIKIGESAVSIAKNAFENCSSLKEVTIADGLESFGYSVFDNCTSLTEITIPYTVTAMGESVFRNCTQLSTLIFEDLPDGYLAEDYLLDIEAAGSGDGAFYNCTSLVEVELPERLEGLGFYTKTSTSYGRIFQGCTSLETVTVNGTEAAIGCYMFQNCTSLTTVYITGGVEFIGPYIFSGCTSLENVYLSDGLVEIGTHAFDGCTGLTSLVIPETVETVGEEAFGNITAGTTIYVAASYKLATMSWLSYSSSTVNSEATTQKWKNNTEAVLKYYLERPDDESEAPDLGVGYWYYDANGDIVEWTVTAQQP